MARSKRAPSPLNNAKRLPDKAAAASKSKIPNFSPTDWWSNGLKSNLGSGIVQGKYSGLSASLTPTGIFSFGKFGILKSKSLISFFSGSNSASLTAISSFNLPTSAIASLAASSPCSFLILPIDLDISLRLARNSSTRAKTVL